MKIKVEYIPKTDLKAYAGNAKLHPAEQVEQIKSSIEQFGFNDPIAVWKDNEIIEGHGRYMAVMEMDDINVVPIIRLDDMTDEQRRAYMLVHNKLTMDTNFDFELLDLELEAISDIDMTEFGFTEHEWSDDALDELFADAPEKEKSEGAEHVITCPHCGKMISVNNHFEASILE